MRAVPILAVSIAVLASLALGAVVAPAAQAQDLVEMAPPTDSLSPIQTPTFEDIKIEAGTALPPKAGSAVLFNGVPTQWRAPMKSNRATTQQIKPHR